MPFKLTIPINRRKLYLSLLLFILSGTIFIALVIPYLQAETSAALAQGDVAVEDYLAPYTLEFESEILTATRRDEAARQVAAVYTPADPEVGRRQLDTLRVALAFISAVRADPYASSEQKLADLAALSDLQLSQSTAEGLLALSDGRWQSVQQESVVVLGQAMRSTIRLENLEETRRNIPALVSLSLTQEQAAIVSELVAQLVIANSQYDEASTLMAQQQARQAVAPVMRTLLANQVILQRGQVISDLSLEALDVFGLVERNAPWQAWAGSIILAVFISMYFVVYYNRNAGLRHDLRAVLVVVALFILFLLMGRVLLPGHIVIPYVYPLAAYSLTLAALFGPELPLMTILPLSLLVSYDLPHALELTSFYTLSSFLGVYALHRAQRITLFFWTGMVIAAAGAVVVLGFQIASLDLIGLTTLCLAAAANGAISAGASLFLQFALGLVLGRATALQLMELSRPDHPLLQDLLHNAPGTYQHSLQVASLAEQAAERIGADPLLTRVGALYHDIGKAANPAFFIENQLAGELNPHQTIGPSASAEIIINHIASGMELARRHRLPQQIRAFITEHHGTMTTRYQYVRAVEAAGGDRSLVNPHQYQYPGPRPQSRETALLMLADGCEAKVRAERPKDEGELHKVIRSVVEDRMKNGELNDTSLTLRDLDTVVESFVATLRGIYHPRIQYPSLDKPTPPGAASPPQDVSAPNSASQIP